MNSTPLFPRSVRSSESHRPFLARAARGRAQAHHSEPARQARGSRHSRFAQAAEADPAADDAAQQPRLHRPGVLGLGRRQMDRGRCLRARAPSRSGHRGQDRHDRRRPRQGAIVGRLPQLLVQRPRAREALDQPARQSRALQRRPPPGRSDRLLPHHGAPPLPRHHGAVRRSYRLNVRNRTRPEARLSRAPGDRARAL